MLARIAVILAEYVGAQLNTIDEKTELRGELGLTSLELIDMSGALEREFGVEIPELKITMSKTVGDILRLVEAYSGEEKK